MTWLRCLMITCLFSIFIPFNTYAQQISRLLCETNWWLSDPTWEEIINAIQDQSDMFQICDENQDRPIHIGLKIETPLSEDQGVFIAFLAYSSGPVALNRFYRNSRGETPLILVEMRLGRAFTNAFNKLITYIEEKTPSEQEIEEHFWVIFQEDIAKEIALYMTIRGVLGDPLEDAWNDVRLEMLGNGIREELESRSYPGFLEDILEQIEQNGDPSDFIIFPNQ